MKTCLLGILLVLSVNSKAVAQREMAHHTMQDSMKTAADTTMKTMEGMDMDVPSGQAAHDQADKLNIKITAPLEDFPTLHPLIVHFPIILLLVAAAI